MKKFSAMFAAGALTLALLTPLAAFAQTSSDTTLRTTIRAELLSDPRTASLSAVQLNAMVDLLTQQAQAQGMTAGDITWHPQTFSGASSGSAGAFDLCASGDFTCIVDEAFGFIGPDTLIPFALGGASMGLIWVIAEMLHRRKHHPISGPYTMPTSGSM